MKALYYALFTVFCLTACKKSGSNPLPAESIDIIVPDNIPSQVKKPSKIVVIGSSTAAGLIGPSVIDSAWFYRLKANVAKEGKKAEFINLAYGGWTTYHAMPNGYLVKGRPAPDTDRNIDKAISYSPTLVIISFPTNDIANYYSTEESLRNFTIITDKLDSAKIAYIVLGTQPRNFNDVSQLKNLKSFNDQLKKQYTSQFDDILELLCKPNYWIKDAYGFGDGVHLNNTGHAIIATTLLNHQVFKDNTY